MLHSPELANTRLIPPLQSRRRWFWSGLGQPNPLLLCREGGERAGRVRRLDR